MIDVEQYKYNPSVFVNANASITLFPSNRYPVIGNLQWKTLEDATMFVNDAEGTAIPGMVIAVVADETESNNGVYFVKSVADINIADSTGVLVKLGDAKSEEEILKIIEDNEHVVVSSLNELNNRVIDNDNTLTEIQTILNDVQTSLSLEYVKDEKKIYLKDKNKQTIGSIDTTDFIKDGMLSAAELILNHDADPDYTETIEYPYIKLTFNVDNGGSEDKKEPIRFPVGELFQVYQGGDGISVVKAGTRPEDYKISIKLLSEQSDYIKFTEGENKSLSLNVVNTLDKGLTGLASAQSVVSYVDRAITNVKMTVEDQIDEHKYVTAVTKDEQGNIITSSKSNLDAKAIIMSGEDAAGSEDDILFEVLGTEVGNLTPGTKIKKSTTLEELLKKMLIKEKFPYIKSNPKNTLNANSISITDYAGKKQNIANNQTYEIDSVLDLSKITSTFTDGVLMSYTESPTQPSEVPMNCRVFQTQYTIKDNNGQETTYNPLGENKSITLNEGDLTIKSTTTIQVAGSFVCKTNIGNDYTLSYGGLNPLEDEIKITGSYKVWKGKLTQDYTSVAQTTEMLSNLKKLQQVWCSNKDKTTTLENVFTLQPDEIYYVLCPSTYKLLCATNIAAAIDGKKNELFVYNHNTKVPYSLYYIPNHDEYKNVRIEKIKEQKN